MARMANVNEFKRWLDQHWDAVALVLRLRVEAQMMRERVKEYITPIFNAAGFTYGPMFPERQGKPLEKEDDLYLAENLTDERALRYFADCDTAHRAHGWTGPEGSCPALTAENLVMIAERELIEAAEPIMGLDPNRVWGEDRKKYLELLIGASVKRAHETGKVRK